MAEHIMGTTEAIKMFEDMLIGLRENHVPAPDPIPSTQAH
jgi:hypothetical protein